MFGGLMNAGSKTVPLQNSGHSSTKAPHNVPIFVLFIASLYALSVAGFWSDSNVTYPMKGRWCCVLFFTYIICFISSIYCIVPDWLRFSFSPNCSVSNLSSFNFWDESGEEFEEHIVNLSCNNLQIFCFLFKCKSYEIKQRQLHRTNPSISSSKLRQNQMSKLQKFRKTPNLAKNIVHKQTIRSFQNRFFLPTLDFQFQYGASIFCLHLPINSYNFIRLLKKNYKL